MDIDEAKEKFGEVVLNDYNNPVWKPNRKRIKGLILSYAQDVDTVFMLGEVHEAEDYIDQFWSWAQGALGDGFDAVFFPGELCDGDSFNRVTKDEVVEFANKLYIVNDEYKDEIDSKTVVVPDIYQLAHDNFCWWAVFEQWHPVERVEFFREGGGSTDTVVPSGSDDFIKENYLYSTKRLALELTDSSVSFSDVEVHHLCDEWIRIMTDRLGHVSGSIFSRGAEGYIATLPSEEDYRDWVASAIENDFEFGESFSRFSNRLSSEDVERTLEPIDRPDISGDDKMEGQVSIGDFCDGGDEDE